MKLTDGEKIIIALLADIHKGLKIDGEIDVKRLMASIYGGHLWSLKWDMTGLLDNTEPEEHEIRQTADILDMWEMIELSLADLTDEGKAEVRAANHGFDPVFMGFDANHDRHYGIARHLIHDMDRWQNFKGRDLNSHSEQVSGYLRMYPVFEPIRNILGGRHPVRMTADELARIFASAYPAQAVA